MTDQPRWDASEGPEAGLSAAQPGSRERPLPLRQMGIGELIDAAVKLYRRDWLALMGIVAFVLVPVTFLQFWITQTTLEPLMANTTPTEADLLQFAAVALVFVVVQLLIVQPFLVAAITRAAADAYMGEAVTIGGTYRYALAKLPAILWITILTAGIAIVAAAAGILAIVLGVAIGGGIGIPVVVAGAILVIVLPTIAFVRLAVAAPVVVVEDVRGTAAVGRSWRLTKGHFWRLLGLLILSALIAGIGSLIITIPTEAIAFALGPNGWPVSALGTVLATVLITPFSVLIVVLLYFDLRIRKEGFDIEVMAQELAPSS
jgi:Membrane domain of glycerophosphoryl diester phosphodiesterase